MSFFCTECSILRSGPRTKDDVCAKCIEKRGQSPQAAPDKGSAGLALLDKAAYISRYATKLQELLGIDAELAKQSAEASFEDWDGVYTPEEAADDEAGYWAADI